MVGPTAVEIHVREREPDQIRGMLNRLQVDVNLSRACKETVDALKSEWRRTRQVGTSISSSSCILHHRFLTVLHLGRNGVAASPWHEHLTWSFTS